MYRPAHRLTSFADLAIVDVLAWIATLERQMREMNGAEAALETMDAFMAPPPSEQVWKIQPTAPGYTPSHMAKGVPPMAYTGGRGPIKRNKAKRWHAKRLAKKVR